MSTRRKLKTAEPSFQYRNIFQIWFVCQLFTALLAWWLRRPPQERKIRGSSHTNDFKIGTPVASLPGACHYRVSAGTGRPGVSIL